MIKKIEIKSLYHEYIIYVPNINIGHMICKKLLHYAIVNKNGCSCIRQGKKENDNGKDVVGDHNQNSLGGGHLGHGGLPCMYLRQMVYQYQQKKYAERKNKTKDEPHVNHLDIRGGW